MFCCNLVLIVDILSKQYQSRSCNMFDVGAAMGKNVYMSAQNDYD